MSGECALVCFVPWLKCGPATLGPHRLTPWDAVDVPPALTESFRNLTKTFVTETAHEVQGCVLGTEDSPLGPTSDDQVPAFWDAVRLFALAAIAETTYFSQFGDPLTSSSFLLVFQDVRPEGEFVTLFTRRRDGQNLSGGHPVERLRFVRPLACLNPVTVEWKQQLLDALATCVGATDYLSVRIREAAVPFFDAARVADYETPRHELAWLASAFEILLGIGDRPKRPTIAEELSRLFRAHPFTGTSRLSNKRNPVCCTRLERWVFEFYDTRSEIHGKRASTSAWHAWEHALLATHVFTLTVKKLLEEDGRYHPPDRDLDRFNALDEQIGQGSPIKDRWESALTAATGYRRRQAMLSALQLHQNQQ